MHPCFLHAWRLENLSAAASASQSVGHVGAHGWATTTNDSTSTTTIITSSNNTLTPGGKPVVAYPVPAGMRQGCCYRPGRCLAGGAAR